jgi:hypothetical protein
MFCMFLVAHVAQLAPAAAPDDLVEQWQAHAATVSAGSPVPIPFDAQDAAVLQAGEVAAHRFDTPEGAYAVGAVWIDAPIEAVWVTIQDAPHDPPGRITTRRLAAPAGLRRVHMTLDLPFPLADRQWVAEVRTAPALTSATGGDVWQRRWDVGDPALATAPDDGAAWVEVNRGAWTLLRTDQGTLAVFSVRTVLGGLVPAPIAEAWAVGTLKRSLAQVAARAEGVQSHYVAGHEPVVGPDGRPIPVW